jgi:hypothetical protein
MLGQRVLAGKLFWQVSLEGRVPVGHWLRRVAAAVDFGDFGDFGVFGVARRLTARFYVDSLGLQPPRGVEHRVGLADPRRRAQIEGQAAPLRPLAGLELREQARGGRAQRLGPVVRRRRLGLHRGFLTRSTMPQGWSLDPLDES